ncbi:SAM-dependent methyltransferase [Euryhalocaulis caribicus]|uniref:SAM-dependent methyltransferase n=1 Tax=Euryhalocaulis caribicus TaxID=1161401 RepID=UPI0003A2072D|nr:SAM-dependent methyltransferase [Euryhalocaulis caribicus]
MSQAAEKNAHVWERDELDWYVEPTAATEALLTVESFVGSIVDPCAGQGNIVNTLRSAGHDACASDVVKRAEFDRCWAGHIDFLSGYSAELARYENFVMNPPFFRAKGAEAFIRRALELATGKVCAFVDIRFIAGAKRANGLFAEHPPHRVWIITPRVSCPPGEYLKAGGEAKGGSADWVWLVWDKTAPFSATHMGWLRREVAA